MRINLYSLLMFLLFISTTKNLNAQGCVAIRHFSCSVGNNLENNLLNAKDFQAGMSYRYFKSFRHFKGTEEEPDRVSNNTEVINNSHAWDFTINYGITNRLYAGLTIPTVINTRSSLYEHGRTERYSTYSRGIADIRLGIGYWIFNPETHTNGNLAMGLGLKLPTGNFNASDIFYNVGTNGEPQVRPVDQSIQPGDGGFGFTLDAQFYQKVSSNLYSYFSGFYLFNPRATNGIKTFRETLSDILINESIMSVPDQYSIRGGLSYSLSNTLSTSIGGRFEGVPVKDVFGKSDGFRRPGNVLSIEPGIAFMKNNISLNLNVPIAIRRDRPQSVTDIETEQMTGMARNGDAAFADYLINFGISYRFKNKTEDTSLNIDFDKKIDP